MKQHSPLQKIVLCIIFGNIAAVVTVELFLVRC